jgi:hypothetical protein
MVKDPDRPVQGHIEQLVDEEHRLFRKDALSADEHARLKEIEVELDQCWDLLRQRRALREFGQNPDEAQVRPPDIVENYQKPTSK